MKKARKEKDMVAWRDIYSIVLFLMAIFSFFSNIYMLEVVKDLYASFNAELPGFTDLYIDNPLTSAIIASLGFILFALYFANNNHQYVKSNPDFKTEMNVFAISLLYVLFATMLLILSVYIPIFQLNNLI